ncbi:RNA polymerase recycling motor HelD [Mesobacillus maritimus]|uniref:UvrD-helicase domain-containing protein n=1 Tax=Mesobacillus maritimus TaxID=1643336 RepID=A0ABS7K3A4_9BACI|nr:RNA polymerase recycling motor HelD [Mesobacillus maritimus]MBY0096741.1 UvrD-helicase domain-containing protein [Mesobacillus maritimus]
MSKEFEYEKRRLAYTRGYMEMVIKAAEQNQGDFQENMKQAMVDLDHLDSSLSYINILTNSKFIEMASTELEALRKLKNKPYFARINFKSEGQSSEEIFYIGKTSLYERDTQEPIIVDWRSPVANIYYDGRLGKVEYESNEGSIEGYLSLKRQYKIEEGKLIDYQDVDLTTTDELLQESLSGKADTRLTEIVSTIQAEQNNVIRADLNRPIIVQGAAGSGKTTIALHRLSYFIYHHAARFKPEQLLIIAPNNMFIGYIAEVLPELGVDKIRQTTYIDYMKLCVSKKLKVVKPEQKLIHILNQDIENEKMVKWLSRFKGSLKYKTLLDRYLKDIRDELSPTEDFVLERYRLTSGKKLRKLFLKDYHYLPYYKRLDKIKEIMKTDVRRKKKQIIDSLEKRFEAALDQALYHIKDEQKRKERVVYVLDSKEERLSTIQNESKSAVKKYMNKLPKETLLDYYKKLIFNEAKFEIYAKELLNKEQVEFFLSYNQKILQKNQVEIEDLAGLFYMQHKIFGIEKDLKAKNIVIDEAQDYSNFQLYALKVGLETDMFTIVGDLAQGIHSYRGLRNWETLRKVIFPRANFMTLQKSYRTTIDIMEVANDVLGLMNENLPKVEPVVRRGNKPLVYLYDSRNELQERIQDTLKTIENDGYQSIAIIGKTDKECKELYKLLHKRIERPIQLLQENEAIKKGCLVIVPSYLSKGLEFDAVLIVSLGEIYRSEEIDIKLLYVAMTRPMHQLYLFAREKEDVLMHEVDRTKWTCLSEDV